MNRFIFAVLSFVLLDCAWMYFAGLQKSFNFLFTQVYEAAVRWLEHEPRRKTQHVHAVLQCIKFPLINRSYLMDTVASSGYLSGEEGRDLMDSAVMYHTVPSRRQMLPSYQVSPVVEGHVAARESYSHN
jgi:hypothetical protein